MHTQTHMHWPGYSLLHADIRIRIHKMLSVLWNRHTQVQTDIQAVLSLPLIELGFSPTYKHTLSLSAERLKYHMAGWIGQWEARWEERGVVKGWAGETSLQLLLCAGTVADITGSSMLPSVPLSLCESGPEHYFSHNKLCLHQSNIALTFLPLWPLALTFLRLFYLFLACFHLSFYPSISFTHWPLLGKNHSPLSSSKCYNIKVKLKLFLMLQLKTICADLCIPFNSDEDQATAIKLTGLVPLCLRPNLWVFCQCVCSSERQNGI